MSLRPGDRLPVIELKTLDGEATTLDRFLGDGTTVVQAVRYYGCLPCQHYLLELAEAQEQLQEQGASLVVVGVAADFQARHLQGEYGLDMPLLLDPDQNLYRALDLPRLRLVDWLHPRTWRRYLPLFVRRYLTRAVKGPTQGRIVGDPFQLPGLVILDADGDVRYLHRGAGLGDYPPVQAVLREVDAVAGAA